MPAKNQDLHGNVPDESPVALLLIDLINDFEFEGAEPILESLHSIIDPIASLIKKARKASIPIIYINDNFGKWQSDFSKLIEHCLTAKSKGKPIVEMFKPQETDYFVLKPKYSAFYGTTLDILLDYLKVKTLILTGITGNMCVLFTANDAFMRDFHLFIPCDCMASASDGENETALKHIQGVLKADTRPSAQITFTKKNIAS